MSEYSENALVEQPTIALFEGLGYETANGLQEKIGRDSSTFGRETTAEVVLTLRLRAALERLNPGLDRQLIDGAIEELTRDRLALSLAHANKDVYGLLKEGVKVTYQADDGSDETETVRVIDWNEPENNDFLLVSQFWVTGSIYKRRCDLVGFVNGLPLLLVELKASHGRIEHAYSHNLRDYKQTIPQLFWYNALIVLSNGGQAKVGSVTAGWEHFSDWKRINDEGETGVVSLETMILGTCEKARFLDLVENFTLFDEGKGGLVKIVAKNHQFLGVNNAVEALTKIRENQGKLGVFWHTQGSGKSYSMVFFSQKVMRRVPGNWTFLVVTDRDDLDTQIYKNFRNTGAVSDECQAESGAHLRRLLKEDHRYLFTLIQKFIHERPPNAPKGWRPTTPYPELSDRPDIIVMTDEAHRSQYDDLALNMRNALPNAAFIGFTGTPLMEGEQETKKVFGDYVSIYNFRQSIEDGATVPLFYENRIPELQLINENLNEDMEDLIEAADLNEEQDAKLEREFAREYHLITRDDRLEKVAEDLVSHFMGRGQGGKGMVVCIDKLTAVRMYDKVRVHWKVYLESLKAELTGADRLRRPELEARIRYMEETDMAVVVSQQQNEVEHFKERDCDIEPHRKRMVTEDLETKFKSADDPFRLVFVCAMWMTGFDAPSVSTIYIDKPMRNHTLMQTIARANRVFGEKNNGLIVDYVGVFRDLQKALAIYGSASGGGVNDGECPIKKKAELVKELRDAIKETRDFCTERGVQLDAIINAPGFQKIASLDNAAAHLVEKQVIEAVDDAVEKVIINDELKKRYLSLASGVVRLYRAILPDQEANEFIAVKACIAVLAEKIRSFVEGASIEDVMEKVEELLDESIATKGYVIHATEKASLIDLSQIDFDALRAHFEKGRKRTEAEKLKAAVSKKLQHMAQLNPTRTDLLEKFKRLIDEYNKGLDVDGFFEKLLLFVQVLNQEDQRALSEQLTEEELAVFDILTRPDLDLTDDDRKQIKTVARTLLQTLKSAKLVLDWRKKLRTRADVLSTVKTVLDDLPRVYSTDLYEAKCSSVYRHVFDNYQGEGQSIYAMAEPRPSSSGTSILSP